MDEQKLQEAITNPQNLGEMADADAVGTVGSPECGDMVRMWLKFKEEGGKKVIDRASFQSFGCQTAIAVASMATEMLKGKTVNEAQNLSASELSRPLGPLPPMKIHCGQMVEGALRDALGQDAPDIPRPPAGEIAPTLAENLSPTPRPAGKIKIVPIDS